MTEHNKACCTLPPVTTSQYEPKGSFIKLAGFHIYKTGSPTATRAIIDVYDIFGLATQTLQGADRLSTALDALVLVPDFFNGAALPLHQFPPDTHEKQAFVMKFISERANVDTNSVTLLKIVEESKAVFGSVNAWGALGLCWGGKLVALTSAADTPFKASGQVHPGRITDEDAEKITIPHICLFSKEDGTPEATESYGKILSKNPKSYVEKYGSMHHGWMGARANLEDEENAKEFARGYDKVASFFAEHL